MTQDTPTVDEILVEWGCCYPSSHCDISFDKGIDHNIGLAKEITTYGNARYEEGVSDCKHKAEIAAYIALNACGVPEEEAVKHARIAVDSVF